MHHQEHELIKEQSGEDKPDTVPKNSQAEEQQRYNKEYFSIKFEPNDLIDLINEENSVENTINSKNYTEFLQNRMIDIEKPQLIKEGYLTSYKLYKIKTKKSGNNGWETIVNRRFNDFEYLHHKLLQNFGGYVLPRLPNKNFLATLNLQTKEFQQARVSELRKYLQRLLNHPQVRFSHELKWFLFEESFNFSSQKGEFIEHEPGTLSGIKTLTEGMISMGKSLFAKYLGSQDAKSQFSKNSQDEMELKTFSRQIEDLVQITKEMRCVIDYSYQELTIVRQFTSLQESPAEQEGITMEQLITEFDQIAQFIESCHEAILRTKKLKQDVDALEEEEAAIASSENQKPRNRELDSVRNKLVKYKIRYQKWIKSLKQELSTYTSEGKTLMQSFVRRFIELQGRIYAQYAAPQ